MKKPHQGTLARWLANPWVNLIGLVSSFVFGVGGTYLTLESVQIRDLTYFVAPTRSVIARSSDPSGLKLSYNGQEAAGDVTIATIAIWNKGDEPIWPQDLLTPVRIVTKPAVRIIERPRVLQVSRSGINFSVDDSQLAAGIVPLSWKVLEENDGALIQLIYEGSPGVEIFLEGELVGQKRILSQTAARDTFLGGVKMTQQITPFGF